MPLNRIKAPVKFDIERIFQRAGGTPGDLQALLEKHLFCAPALPAIQMWRSRRVVPASWLASVLYALMKEGVRVYELMVRVQGRP